MDRKDGPTVFPLCLVTSLFTVLFFLFLEWIYRLNSGYKIKPSQTPGSNTSEGEQLCHAEVRQSHSFNLNALSFLAGHFTISKAKFSPCKSQHECSILAWKSLFDRYCLRVPSSLQSTHLQLSYWQVSKFSTPPINVLRDLMWKENLRKLLQREAQGFNREV